MELFFDIETVLTLNWIVLYSTVLTFNYVLTKSVFLLNWIGWIRTAWLNWIGWNRIKKKNKLYLHLNFALILNWIVRNWTVFIKMDFALNNLQRLICHKTHTTNQPTLLTLLNHLITVKLFQVFLCITKNSIKHQSFVYSQLNDEAVIFLTVQFSISRLCDRGNFTPHPRLIE